MSHEIEAQNSAEVDFKHLNDAVLEKIYNDELIPAVASLIEGENRLLITSSHIFPILQYRGTEVFCFDLLSI